VVAIPTSDSRSGDHVPKLPRRSLAIAILAIIGVLAFRAAQPYDRDRWLEDLRSLESQLAGGYASFDWAAETGRAVPSRLAAAAERSIREGRSDRDAKRAIGTLLAGFDDGHLGFEQGPPAFVAAAMRWWEGRQDRTLTRGLAGAEACSRLGYGNERRRSVLASVRGYVPVASDEEPFPSGVLPAGGERIGVIRIPLFSEHAYLDSCAATWERFRNGMAGDRCDEACADELSGRVSNDLLALFEQRVHALQRAGATAIVVDITGNGGGNDIVDPMARLLTRTRLRGPAMGFVRHPHWVRQLEASRDALRGDLARTDLAPGARARIADGVERVERLLAEARRPCPAERRWREEAPGGCSGVVRGGLYATGLFDHFAPGELIGIASAGELFGPSRYVYREGAYAGRLVVLVDRRTASASEYFAAVLRDNGAATIVGERTMGAGCGYTNGGIPVVLPYSGLRIRMPDCVRYRADGRSELEGVVPDVTVDWGEGDRGAQAVDGLKQALRDYRSSTANAPATVPE
jgi:hypothetical protein